MENIGEKTLVGLLTASIIAIGVGIRKGILWLVGVDQKLKQHDIEIISFSESLKSHVEREEENDLHVRDLLIEISSSIKETNVKVQLLMDNKIK